MKPSTLALISALTGTFLLFSPTPRADAKTALWIDRAEVEPWLPALDAAAARSGLPVALLAELIGQESGFQNIRNRRTSAFGFGQQIKDNQVMAREHLDRHAPAESILGAAIQFEEALVRTGSVEGAARAYGTTAGLPRQRRHCIVRRLLRAARGVDTTILLVSYSSFGNGG